MAVVIDDFENGVSTLLEFKDMSNEQLLHWLPDPEAVEVYIGRLEKATKERRSLSKVDRTIHRGFDSCELCRTNTDPRNVPVHPHCTCDIATQDVEVGQTPSDHPNFRVMSTADEEIVFLSESDLPVAITMDPATTAVLDVNDFRFGDVARWLEQVQPYLVATDQFLSIVELSDENVGQAADVAEALAEGTDIVEAISAKRIWLSIAKAVTL